MRGLSACIYQPLPGTSLETIFKECPEEIARLMPALASFILDLHKKGLYFRSLHLGNILHISESSFGLIDFLDLSRKGRQLNSWETKRNLEHLRKYLQRRKMMEFPMNELIHHYRFAARSQKPRLQ